MDQCAARNRGGSCCRRHVALARHPSGQPGWSGLAVQLHLARTAQPGYNCVLADSGMRALDVATANDLRMYLAQTATDFAREQRETTAKRRRGEWAGDGDLDKAGRALTWLRTVGWLPERSAASA